jgi:CheY-like chemotaxis protein
MVQSGTILLVEDAETDAILIREAFRKARIANPIYRVATGAEAMSYLEGSGRFADRAAHPVPEFVLLDIGLPDTTGFQILRRMKSNADTARIPVVVVTGSEQPSAEAEAQSSGASGFFRKTLRFEDLLMIVRKIGGEWGLVVPRKPL